MATVSKNIFANQSYMNWDTTLEIAQSKLEAGKPQEIAERAAVSYLSAAEEFLVPFLNQEYRVRYPSGEVYLPQGEQIEIVTRILILHYLAHAEGAPLQHKWISFKEIPGGQVYINPFHNRAIRPLIKLFGQDSRGLIRAGLALGGKKEDLGDASVMVPVFPMVPVTYVIWEGDEEFEPSGNILFDESAPHYLPLEDYAVIGGNTVFALRKQLDLDA
jgi:hypothetical protein